MKGAFPVLVFLNFVKTISTYTTGLPGSHKQKRPDQPLKKQNSTEKSQIHDKYTTTPLKHPNAVLKCNMYIFCT